ncbi:hypothetical protein [Bifidobacterium tibiigranuli]|jgi:hypothetical protein|uniref:hypothetical protein n=1 Tax=Bifidobacterium tibiigranuli TaxID=2172043 RepID=UPI0023573CFD|nr:hypothetical protein [Bifidobacterium tibiigranuli]MCI1211162.1 hypothetical protein [Bifidobacterium tibiigranuli]MCI1220328.1 hypothetical protein [Bifidobacterium tibiigranuli]MCI1231989.1 hypothetical protein [Bifidobacterium tibiigranuli]
MATNFIPGFLQDEKEALKRKERTAREFSRAIEDFRTAAGRLREVSADIPKVFGINQQETAKLWTLTATEKRIAFDQSGKLVPAPEQTTSQAQEDTGEAISADTNGQSDTTAGEPDPQTQTETSGSETDAATPEEPRHAEAASADQAPWQNHDNNY